MEEPGPTQTAVDSDAERYQHTARGPEATNSDGDGGLPGHDDSPDQLYAQMVAAAASQEESPSLFSLRRPRDLLAGLTSGTKSVAKGVLGGLTSLIALPIAGVARGVESAKSGTVGGVVGGVLYPVAGVAAGAIGGALLPAAGATVACVQAVRGVANTGVLVYNKARGKRWDQHTREWVGYDPHAAIVLDIDEFDHGDDDEHDQHEADGQAARHTNDPDDLYGVLGVEPSASQEQIRRQYFVLARQLHPDKNQGDEETQEKFQALSRAYQVLSDPSSREKYDHGGMDSVQDPTQQLDPALLFTMLFGSAAFDDYIGQLTVATAASLGDRLSQRRLQREQLQRIYRLTVLLIDRLDKAVLAMEGTPEQRQAFEQSLVAEANRLVAVSFGARLLLVVARCYRSAALRCLGGFRGLGASLSAMSFTMRAQLSAGASAVGAFFAARRAEKRLTDYEESRQRQDRPDSSAEHSEQASRESMQPTTSSPVQDQATSAGESAAEQKAAGADLGEESSLTNDDKPEDNASAASPDENGAGQAAGTSDEQNADDVTDAAYAEAAERARLEQEVQAETLPRVMKAMWRANVVDVDSILRQVTRLALYGGSWGLDKVPTATRNGRAHALLHISEVFLRVATERRQQEREEERATHMSEAEQARAAAAQMEAAAQAAVIRQHEQQFGHKSDSIKRSEEASSARDTNKRATQTEDVDDDDGDDDDDAKEPASEC